MSDRPICRVLLSRAMQARCFDEESLGRLARITDLGPPLPDGADEAAQTAAAAGAEIVITGWGTLPLSSALLDGAPGLRLLCHSAGSVKHLLGPDFRRRRIRVASAGQALAVGVAEYAFGLMLVSMKAAWQYNALTHRGVWDAQAMLDWVREPHGATVGIVGASRVGREMIRLCRNLSLAAILVYDPYLSAEEARALGAEKTELDDLMRRSDVVSVHTPAIEACRHIVNARNLALLKDRAILINTARGMCVDEAALIDELRRGRILACIDVTDPEPPAPDSPLFALPNCILTPHIAGAIKGNTRRQGALVVDQIQAYLRGEPIPGEIDLDTLDRLA
jgi:phosphoglycerate dehydrogenase-like enzyme